MTTRGAGFLPRVLVQVPEAANGPKIETQVVGVEVEHLAQVLNVFGLPLERLPHLLGRNFFTQLAPCSSNRLFHGRFRKGIRKGTLDERFTHTFLLTG